MNQINVIAEIANSHQGDPKLALEIAKEVVIAGANSIKFQIYFADEFLTTTHPRYEHFKKQAFSKDEWAELLHESKKLGVEVYVDIFGLEAYEIAQKYNVDGYKLHSSDLNNTKLLEELALQKKKVFLATGGSTVLEIRYALDKLNKYKKPSEIIMLHGFQAYPTKVEDSVLSRIEKIKELFDDSVSVGYSDHISGDDKFATILPLMTIPYGVQYIEKHVTFDRGAKGVDYYSSYEPKELEEFIEDVRLAEKSIGKNPLSFAESEKIYRNAVKKSWTTTKKLSSGDTITPDDIIMKRTPYFFAPPIYEEIINSKLSNNIENEGSISRALLDNKVLAIIVARSDSSRLLGKATKEINGIPSIAHLFERVKIAKEKGHIDTIAFCTTTLDSDNQLVDIAKDYPMNIYRGEVEDVLSRMMLAVDDNQNHNIVLRITGDDILIDSEYLKKTVDYHLEKNAHYTDAKRLPSGTEVEVFDSYILKLIYELSKDSSGSEYLTNYITNNEDQFVMASLEVEKKHDEKYRLTLDTAEDFEVIKTLLEYLKSINREFDYDMDDIFNFFKNNPEVLNINKPINQKAAPITVNTEINWQNFTKLPLVTVYITSYNYDRFIKESIDSVIKQKFRDFEVIIIDDGSTDNSKQIIEQYRNHPKVTIIYQENKGLNITNNIAIKLAKGKYIMRLDADDYLNENALTVMSQKLNCDDSLALVFPDYYLIDVSGNIVTEEKRHDFKNVTMYDQPAHGACTMIRKDVLIELEGYSEEFTRQDGYELWIKVIKNKKVANIDLALFYYRQHGNNLTSNKEKLYNTRYEIVKKHTQELDIKSMNHIAIIPLRDDDDDSMALKKFADTTLLDITIKSLLLSENIKKIIITTPNEKIISYLENKYKDTVIIDKRPIELARVNTHMDDTVKYVVSQYNLDDIDSISIVNYEHPLRKNFYIDNAINTLYLFDADSIISVSQENSNFYTHKGNGLEPFITNSELRLERDFIYKEAGGLHVVKANSFKQNGKMLGARTTHIVLDEKSAKSIGTVEDFDYLEYSYKKENNV